MTDRFLSGVPGSQIEAIYQDGPGNEIATGKFDSPRSSANLAANTFGLFLNLAADLPPLPGCEQEAWPASSLTLEGKLRFPWNGGRHPVLDVLVTTPSALIGIESKRFEPFGKNRVKALSDAYRRPCWGDRMTGYERVRDRVGTSKGSAYSLDAAQLFKHALALRTQVNKPGEHQGLTPILFYLYAEPGSWPDTGLPIEEASRDQHREEIAAFAKEVDGDEVKFVACTYRQLLEGWVGQGTAQVSRHAAAVFRRFAP